MHFTRWQNNYLVSLKSGAGAFRRTFFPFVLLSLLFIIPCLSAEELDSPEMIDFHIPQQRADLSLTQFSEQANRTFVFSYELVRQKIANEVVGTYSVEDAIGRLLEGTGLYPVFNRDGVLTVTGDILSVEKNGDDEIGDGESPDTKSALASEFGGNEPFEQGEAKFHSVLEEVIVTARRREESLADMPMSIVAFSADMMEVHGITNTEQIGEFAANTTMTEADRIGHTRVIIRGIGGGHPVPLRVFGTGMYVDGHYLAGSKGNYMSTIDIERVEVLRGPQGTLYGKNTTGGLVNIISTKPKPEFESSIVLRAGEYGQQDVRGMLNIPFSDKFFGRFAVSSEESDGAYFNRYLDKHHDYTDVKSVRGAFRYVPNENWTFDLAASKSKERSGQMGMQCQVRPTQALLDSLTVAGQDVSAYTGYANNTSEGVGAFGPDSGFVETLYPGATIDMWESCLADKAQGDRVLSSELEGWSNMDAHAVFGTVNWNSNGAVGGTDGMDFMVNASYRTAGFPWAIDRDGTSLPVEAQVSPPADPGGDGSHSTTKSLELLFNSQIGDRLNLLVGAHFFDEETGNGDGNCYRAFEKAFAADPTLSTDTTCERVGLLFQNLPGALKGSRQNFQDINVFNESKAVFAHVNYALSDNWELEAGARWTEDKRRFQIVEFDVSATCIWNPPGRNICEPTPIINFETTLQNGFFNDASATFSEVTPMISLRRTNIGNGMIYGVISEGFLTGGFNDEFNLLQNPELEPLVSYGPEHVTNYEVGYKGLLADGRVSIAVDVFVMDYTDKQEQVLIDNNDGRFGPDQNIDLTGNAGSVDISGLELELRATLWDGGNVTLDVGYLKNEYSKWLSADIDNPGEFEDRSGRNIADLAPDWTVNASVMHKFVLSNGATLIPMLGLYAQGGYEWLGGRSQRSDPKSYCYQEAYAKFRGRLSYEPAGERWRAALFGSNIYDEKYLIDCAPGRQGTYRTNYGSPAAWGLEFAARWGGE